MTGAWEINASPLLVQLRPRNAQLANSKETSLPAPALPAHGEPSASAREDVAYARGRMDGEKAVHEQLLRQRQDIRELQDKVLETLRRAAGDVVRDTEESLVALAIQVAERLVSGLSIDSEMVRSAISEALSQVKESTECHIYLHPDDLNLLQQGPGAEQSLAGKPASGAVLHFHANPEIERGGCLVKTRFGTVDGQRRTKVEQLRKTLLS